MEAREQTTQTSTLFGQVTDKRISYNVRKWWWSGNSVEDIPLRHVTSVRLESARHTVLSIFLILFGLIVFLAADDVGKVFGVIILAVGAFFLWPAPKVVVNTAGGDLRPSVGPPWSKPEAEKFVGAVRNQLFKDDA